MLRVWPDWPISILGAQINMRFSFEWVVFRSSERRRFWGCGVGLGRLGFAGGLVRGSAASLDPIGRFRFGVKLTRDFHLTGFGAGSAIGIHTAVFFMVWPLEGRPESRWPFWRVRAVCWWVTVGVGAPGQVWGVQRAYRGSQDCMSPPGFFRV